MALCLAFAASAAAEVRSGTATDGTEPERIPGSIDIVGVSASYDTAGSMQVAVTTVAPPPVTEEVVLTARSGVLSGGECVAPLLAIVGTYVQPPAVAWGTSYGNKGEGSESISGTTTTLTATDPALANQPFDCVEPAIYEVGEEGELVGPPLEGLTAPILLVGPPPPPASPAPPAPPPPPPPPTPKAANLTFPSKAVTLRRNAWKKITIKVTNVGNAAAGKVSLRVGKAKGVAIKPKSGTLKLKSIAAGKSKVASFKVRLGKQAKARSKLALAVVGARGVKASGALTIKAWKRPGRPGKGKGKGKKEGTEPAPPAAPLAEKIFYRLEMKISESAALAAITFVDGTWAYTGMPSGGLPTCTGVTGGPETEGCVKYTYDPASGTVRLESVGSGKITAGGSLEIGDKTYSPTAIPAAGTRLQVEQEYIGFSGFCGPFSTCTTWHEYVTLTSGGEFILSRQSLTTSDGPGAFVAAGSYPPDQHGTYAIEGGARIKLNFADGTSQTKTIAILLNKEGKPDPVNEGLLLDSSYFTFAHTG